MMSKKRWRRWSERIYVIDRDGRIRFKGGIGPFYFEPETLRRFLRTMTRGDS